jgi:hypothetical protein
VISLIERSVLPAGPERVWRFFDEIETNYPFGIASISAGGGSMANR